MNDGPQNGIWKNRPWQEGQYFQDNNGSVMWIAEINDKGVHATYPEACDEGGLFDSTTGACLTLLDSEGQPRPRPRRDRTYRIDEHEYRDRFTHACRRKFIVVEQLATGHEKQIGVHTSMARAREQVETLSQ